MASASSASKSSQPESLAASMMASAGPDSSDNGMECAIPTLPRRWRRPPQGQRLALLDP
jgi:hypothetical protein